MRKIICILTLISSLNSFSAEFCPEFEKSCTALVEAQDKDIERLHAQVKVLNEKNVEVVAALPFYVWFGAGILAGGAAVLFLTNPQERR